MSWIMDTYHLHFVCAVSYKRIDPPIKIKVTKKWIDKCAPVFAVSLFLLKTALKAATNVNLTIDLPHVGNASFQLTAESLQNMLDTVCEIFDNRKHFDRMYHMRC